MAPDTQSKTCLDVAVDHRIRRLFKPVSNDLTERSNHVSRIKARGWSLKRPHREIEVTSQLAGPALKGGIAVALQQPRHNHLFEEGLDAVIQNCETLHALDDVFSVVSCGTLDIRTNITIADLLPYVSEKIASIDDATLKASFRTSLYTMLDKEPSVLLCAGRIWLSNIEKPYNCKGDAYKLESIGVGVKFGAPKPPITARIRREEGRGFVTIRRVNGFHPSYAMNHHPNASLLRQLQILVGAETCGILRGDWEEKEWMGELRCRCKDISGLSSESLSQSPQPQNSGQRLTIRNDAEYLPDYRELYSDKLLSIYECVQSLISGPMLAMKSSTALYKLLLCSGLSEKCNDATLILRQMFRLQCKGWPSSVAWKNEEAIERAASDTIRFTKDLREATEASKGTQLSDLIRQEAISIRKSVLIRSGRRSKYELDFGNPGNAFLQLATSIETLLMDLLLEQEKALYALGQEDVLSNKMAGMTLQSAVK